MTRVTPYIILVVGAACAGPDLLTAPGPPPPGPAEARFTVTGVVYDSLASHVGPALAVPGVRVSVNGVVDITDAAGRFTVTGVLGGSHVPLELLSLNYEPRANTMLIDRDLTVSLPVRRLAPLITAFFPPVTAPGSPWSICRAARRLSGGSEPGRPWPTTLLSGPS